MYESLIESGVKVGVVAALVGGVIALKGCSNTSGAGNEFDVQGRVVEVGERSVHLDVGRVAMAHGDAKRFFHDGKDYQVHDNYRDCGSLGLGLDIHTVGHETDIEGQSIKLSGVHTGEQVELTGKLRDSYDTCGKYSSYGERPVFDRLTVQAG